MRCILEDAGVYKKDRRIILLRDQRLNGFPWAFIVRRQRSLDRPGGLNKGEFLAHRNVHRSEDETANPSIEGTS